MVMCVTVEVSTINSYRMLSKLYPTLMVVMNSEYARWLVIDEKNCHEIDHIHDSQDRYSDQEGWLVRRGRGIVLKQGAPDVFNRRKAAFIHEHLLHVAQKTKELWGKGLYRLLVCVEPEQYKNMLSHELGRVLPPLNLKIIPGNYGHDSVRELQQLFLNHRLAV